MRLLNTLCLVLLLSGFAAAQAIIVGGTAGNWGPSYGPFGVPLIPLVTTPSVTLANAPPASAGASSNAFGLVAGATNATLSLPVQAGPSVYSEAVWYGSAAPEAAAPSSAHGHQHEMSAFDFVSSEGRNVAGRVPHAGEIRKAARTYTNQDVEHVNDTNGTVKYRGKTEHI